MSLLVTLSCGDRQLLLEVGETIPDGELIPWSLYPIDTGTSIEPGDGMTCITCNEPRMVTEVA